MRIHHARLRAKGWSDEEIEHARGVIKQAEEAKHPAYKFLEKAVFWGLLFLTLVGSFIVSVVLLPLLLVLPDLILALLLILFGLVFGSLFVFAIQDVEWLERKHHLATLVGLATVALLNIRLIDGHTRGLSGQPHHTLLLGIIFALTLITPYAIHLFEREVQGWQ